ncbi:MAG: DUF4169 family protein [Rhodospirillaceae bacterium]|nr:DUF4169 family protein [Rhodospirillaceae bacterium]
MAEIINLNRAKKAKARDSEERLAAENRVRFGRTKVEKANDRREMARREQLLAGKELTAPRDSGEKE